MFSYCGSALRTRALSVKVAAWAPNKAVANKLAMVSCARRFMEGSCGLVWQAVCFRLHEPRLNKIEIAETMQKWQPLLDFRMTLMALRIVLFMIAAALTAAHFLRAGSYGLVALSLATPLLFFFTERRWSLMLLQMAAYGATLNWMLAIVLLVQMRQQVGRPWTTAALILGAVALLTLLAGLLLNSRNLRERYP